MAPLSIPQLKPKEEVSPLTTPPVLREALYHIFSNAGEGLWLVGGTALAGYYAQHRRSDDLDLFAVDSQAHRAAILAVKSLTKLGAILSNERSSPYYYHTDAQWKQHRFTTDVVLDENLHRIGSAIRTQEGVWVADLPTLFATKAACLVSRCSEKDLFDLDWIISQMKEFRIQDLIEMGVQVDGGLNVETLLISLNGARLRKEACHFLLPQASLTVDQAFRKINELRQKLIETLITYEKKLPISEGAEALSQSLKDQKKLK